MLFTYYSCQLSCRLSGTQNTLNDEPHGVLEHYQGCSVLDIQVSKEVVILTLSTSTLLHLKSKIHLHFYHNCYVLNTSYVFPGQSSTWELQLLVLFDVWFWFYQFQKKGFQLKVICQKIVRLYLVKLDVFFCQLY